MHKLIAMTAAVAAIAFAAATPARASIIFTLGNNPQADESNILFEGTESGTTIFGEVDHSGIAAKFNTLTGQTLWQKAQGQADIFTLTGDPLTSMEVSVPGYGFADFILNLQNGTGQALVDVTDSASSLFHYSLGHGQKYLTVVSDGDPIVDIRITAYAGDFGFDNFKQPRISGVCSLGDDGCGSTPPPSQVPEPASMVLLGAGLMGLGLIRRRG